MEIKCKESDSKSAELQSELLKTKRLLDVAKAQAKAASLPTATVQIQVNLY
jgi:hypothetical protein